MQKHIEKHVKALVADQQSNFFAETVVSKNKRLAKEMSPPRILPAAAAVAPGTVTGRGVLHAPPVVANPQAAKRRFNVKEEPANIEKENGEVNNTKR